MVKKRGFFIIFEGPDGAGKSTLAKALIDYFKNQNQPCFLLGFPGNETGTLGKHVYSLHHHPENFGVKEIFPESLQLMHIAAHIDAIENRIKPLLQSGKILILDRYWWSTWVYGINNGVNKEALNDMIDLERKHWKDYTPDAIFLIDRQKSLRPEVTDDHWTQLKVLYLQLAQNEQTNQLIRIIPNETSPKDALDKILNVLNQDILAKFEKRIKKNSQSQNKCKQNNLQIPLGFDISSNNLLNLQSIYSYSSLSPAIPTEVFDTYWLFAAERQNIFFKRLEGALQPWTQDLILRKYKFTNAYRASDRVSQFLIRNVIYLGNQTAEEIFFRTILFKIFNRISTWELLSKSFGEISLKNYDFDKYDQILSRTINNEEKIFSAAYIMPSRGPGFHYPRKHQVYLKLLETMLADEVPLKLADAKSMKAGFNILRAYPLMGDFLAYQYITDINYSRLTDFSESEFVVPGPGAKNGIRKCFRSLGGLNEVDIIKLMADRQEKEFERLEITFRSLWGRRLQFIDCQNLFCEVDKYARVAHPDIEGISDRKRIKQVYKQDIIPIHYWYPPKWGINDLLIQFPFGK